MNRTKIFKQKQAGLMFIILGIFMGIGIFVFLNSRIKTIPGFPELVPKNETALFMEFPLPLDETINNQIKNRFNFDLTKAAGELAALKGALAFLSAEQPSENEYKLLPFLFFQTASAEKSFSFLKTYKNEKGEIRQFQKNGITAFSAPSINFAFISDILIVSPSAKGLETLLSYQTQLTKRLNTDADFIKIRRNLQSPYFIYMQPDKLPQTAYEYLSKFIPITPLQTFAFGSAGISAEKQDGAWHGSSYAPITEQQFSNQIFEEHAYRAALLPYLPPDFDLLISGQNLQNQIKKIENLVKKDAELPSLSRFSALFGEEYLPGIDIEKEVFPVLSKEFAFTVNGGKILFIAELKDKTLAENIEKLRYAFKNASGKFAASEKEIKLPDGDKAYELIPDPSKVEEFSETFEAAETKLPAASCGEFRASARREREQSEQSGSASCEPKRAYKIKGFLFEKKRGIFEATAQDKWFVSNDLSSLKKALLLTKEPGLNFRESKSYKKMLQPILKNPELLGLARFSWGSFSFSKRTALDHMETNFVIMVD